MILNWLDFLLLKFVLFKLARELFKELNVIMKIPV